MCNAIKYSVPAMILALMAFTSCSKGKADKKAAEALLVQAQECLDMGKSQEALDLLDSLDRSYPSQIDARRHSTILRPKAIEAQTMQQIVKADSVIAYTAAELENVEGLMKHISRGDMAGYYVVADAYNPSFINSTGFEPRVSDDDFQYYIVAQTIGKRPNITQISLESASGSMTSQAIPASSDRRMQVEGSELASFITEEVADLAEWAVDNQGTIKSGKIIGQGTTIPINFNNRQGDAFATAWRFSQLKQKLNAAANLRIKLERQLQVARDQVANTTPDEQ